MRLWRILVALLLLVLVAGGAFVAYASYSTLEPVTPPDRSAFDAGQLQRGAELAAIGNCNVCHTAQGGKPFAGGLPIPTPFGTIFSTNITPDPDDGIGRWSEAAFIRAMRQGVDREGNHLYPAFPYDHFTKVSDDDNRALYAFLMTRQPVSARTPANELRFPINHRILLAGWKLLFFRQGVYRADAAKDAVWNRGAYLAEGLGHCGACHTPRNLLGAEKPSQHFGGGAAEGWFAYAINAASPAPVAWDAEALHAYLRQGWHEIHGVSRGSMAPVTTNLGSVPDEDVRAIATYVASVMGEPTPEKRARGEAALRRAQPGSAPGTKPAAAEGQARADMVEQGNSEGAAIYAAACASCHESGRPVPYGGLNLHLSSAMNGPNPQNIVNVVLFGLPAAEGEASAIMPGFDGAISDRQLIALLRYLRDTFGSGPAWENMDRYIREARQRHSITLRPSDGTSRAPAEVSSRATQWQ